MITDLSAALSQYEPFRRLSSEKLLEVAGAVRLVKFASGQVIIRPDELPKAVDFVLEGRVRMLGFGEQNRIPFTLSTAGPGAWCGLVSIVNQVPLEAVTASVPVVCARISWEPLQEIFASLPEFRRQMLEVTNSAEVYDALASRIGREPAGLALRSLGETASGVAVVQDEFPNPREGVVWVTSGDGRELPRGEIWPNGKTPSTPAGLRFLGLPAAWLAQKSAREDEPARPELESLAEPHHPDYPEIRAAAGPDAICACLKMLGTFFGRTPNIETAIRLIKARKAGEPGDFFFMGTLMEAAGLRAQLIRVQRDKLAAIEVPAVLSWMGQPAVLFASDAHRTVISSPTEGLVRLSLEERNEKLPEELEMLLVRAPEEVREKFSFHWFFPAIRQHKRVLLEVLLASFFVQIFALANPLITQVIIDKVLVQNSLPTLNVVGALLIIVAISGAVTTALRTYLFVDTTNRIDLALGTRIVDHLYRLTLGYFHKRPVGEVTSRLNELENIRQFLTGTALTVVLDGIFSVIYIAIMLFYNVTLTIVALAALPLLGLMTYGVAPVFREQLRRRARHMAASQAYLVETLTGVQTIKAQNLEQRARWEWQERYARFVSDGFRTSMTTTTVNSITGLLSKLSDLGVLWVGAYMVIEGKLSLGQLIAFRIIAGYVTGPLLRLIQSWQNFQEVGLSIERLGDIMASPPEQTEEQSRNIPLPVVQGRVRYENVTFAYSASHAPQLKNVSFEVPEGAFVGIVGQSGSGKSTLVKLLARLYVPDSGRILIDGYDVNKVEMVSLRRQVATVLQDSLLFDVTVRDNIAVGDPNASSERIIEAARIADAHDFIMSLPDGYNTRVGEQGRALSGGQRQRIAIARALLQSPRLLILDEATSALDFPTEHRVSSNLGEALRGKTVFFVTHRLRSLEKADIILVMENGVLVERGNHRELLDKRGVYYCLHHQQATE